MNLEANVARFILSEGGAIVAAPEPIAHAPSALALRTPGDRAPPASAIPAELEVMGRRYTHLKGGLFVSAAATDRDIAALFSLVASTWEEDEIDAAFNHAVYRQLGEAASASLSAEPAAVLDFGCGTGVGREVLRRRFPQAALMGFDLSSQMAAIAGARGYRVVGERSGQLDLERGSVDVVVSAFVLHLIQDDAWLAEVARVLRPGGAAAWNLFDPAPDWRQTLQRRFAAAGLVVRHAAMETFAGGEVQLRMPLIVTTRSDGVER